MASGRAHSLASVGIAATVGGTLLIFGHLVEAALIGVGALVGIVLSPDLDLKSALYPRKATGWLYPIYSFYWWPYATIIKHRHWLSHMPLIGTAIRVLYQFWWAFLLFRVEDYPRLLWVFYGLVLSDTMHWIMDR